MTKTFDSELREEIEHLVFDGTMDTWKKDFDDTIKAIKLLISKYAPEKIWDELNKGYTSGWNFYRAELFREMGIE